MLQGVECFRGIGSDQIAPQPHDLKRGRIGLTQDPVQPALSARTFPPGLELGKVAKLAKRDALQRATCFGVEAVATQVSGDGFDAARSAELEKPSGTQSTQHHRLLVRRVVRIQSRHQHFLDASREGIPAEVMTQQGRLHVDRLEQLVLCGQRQQEIRGCGRVSAFQRREDGLGCGATLVGAAILEPGEVLLAKRFVLFQLWRQLRPGRILEAETPKQDEQNHKNSLRRCNNRWKESAFIPSTLNHRP